MELSCSIWVPARCQRLWEDKAFSFSFLIPESFVMDLVSASSFFLDAKRFLQMAEEVQPLDQLSQKLYGPTELSSWDFLYHFESLHYLLPPVWKKEEDVLQLFQFELMPSFGQFFLMGCKMVLKMGNNSFVSGGREDHNIITTSQQEKRCVFTLFPGVTVHCCSQKRHHFNSPKVSCYTWGQMEMFVPGRQEVDKLQVQICITQYQLLISLKIRPLKKQKRKFDICTFDAAL